MHSLHSRGVAILPQMVPPVRASLVLLHQRWLDCFWQTLAQRSCNLGSKIRHEAVTDRSGPFKVKGWTYLESCGREAEPRQLSSPRGNCRAPEEVRDWPLGSLACTKVAGVRLSQTDYSCDSKNDQEEAPWGFLKA